MLPLVVSDDRLGATVAEEPGISAVKVLGGDDGVSLVETSATSLFGGSSVARVITFGSLSSLPSASNPCVSIWIISKLHCIKTSSSSLMEGQKDSLLREVATLRE